MIECEITLRSGGVCRIRASGHAELAPAGQDIVCAGVSALLCALKITLEKRGEDCGTLDGGAADIYARDTDGKIQSAFECAANGISGIAAGYPGCVHVRYIS